MAAPVVKRSQQRAACCGTRDLGGFERCGEGSRAMLPCEAWAKQADENILGPFLLGSARLKAFSFPAKVFLHRIHLARHPAL